MVRSLARPDDGPLRRLGGEPQGSGDGPPRLGWCVQRALDDEALARMMCCKRWVMGRLARMVCCKRWVMGRLARMVCCKRRVMGRLARMVCSKRWVMGRLARMVCCKRRVVTFQRRVVSRQGG